MKWQHLLIGLADNRDDIGIYFQYQSKKTVICINIAEILVISEQKNNTFFDNSKINYSNVS